MTEEQRLCAEELGISPEILALDLQEMKFKAVDWHARALRFENKVSTGAQYRVNAEMAAEWRSRALFLEELISEAEQRESNTDNAKWGMF